MPITFEVLSPRKISATGFGAHWRHGERRAAQACCLPKPRHWANETTDEVAIAIACCHPLPMQPLRRTEGLVVYDNKLRDRWPLSRSQPAWIAADLQDLQPFSSASGRYCRATTIKDIGTSLILIFAIFAGCIGGLQFSGSDCEWNWPNRVIQYLADVGHPHQRHDGRTAKRRWTGLSFYGCADLRHMA